MKKNLFSVIMGLIMMLLLQQPTMSHAALPGDLNNDGVVSISEVQAVVNAFLGVAQNAYIGNYTGSASVFFEGAQNIFPLTFVVNASGNVTGSMIDVTDNNQFYAISGTMNLTTGALTASFQLTGSHETIQFTGSPTNGTLAKLGTSIAGTYSTTKQ